ncbi:MAG: cell division protein FtsA [Deltaproteobacteria bacterium]|nr:cell division protein FtsA [Deltaproteobacteria bacterium]
MPENEIITALDIGTTKVCCLVATPSAENGVNIIGIGNAQSTGVSKGMVTNVERTVNSIRAAVREAELMAGIKIKKVFLGIAGGNVVCFNSHGVVGVRDTRARVITEEDRRRVELSAMSGEFPPDRELLHSIPQEYAVDGQTDILNPVGMTGVRLEVNMHITTVSINAIQNVLNCANLAGLNVEEDDVVLESLASAESVLYPSEKEMGVAILDFGGGTLDLGIFVNGCIRHTKVLNLGGDSLTRDIFVILRTTMEAAETLKINEGCCSRALLPEDSEFIKIPGMVGENQVVSREVLCDILSCRVEEIFSYVNQELIVSGYDKQVMEIVITGGSSLLKGVPEVATEIFERQVRVGYPMYVQGFASLVTNPKFSTALGLLLYAYRRDYALERRALVSPRKPKGFFGSIFDRFIRGPERRSV